MQGENRGIYFTKAGSQNGYGDNDLVTDVIEDLGDDSDADARGFRMRWLFIAILVIIPMLTAGTVATATFLLRLYETLPIHTQSQNIQQALVTRVFDANGDLLHEFSIERRFWMPLDSIPKNLQNAIVAIEDRKFYRHWGVDGQRNISAMLVNYSRGRRAQGASTITQQLARNVYLTADKSMIRKLREILTAIHLERIYTKDEILELYLNQAYLGAGVYGVQAASERYFSKPISELTLGEAAILAGVIQMPERLRPDREANIARVTARRNTVLRAMADMGFISESQELAARAEPIEANPHVAAPTKAPYFVEMVRRYAAEKYGNDLLYNGGLEIHTTLNSYAQDSTEASVARQIASLQSRLNRIFLEGTRAERSLGISREEYLRNFDSIYAHNIENYRGLHDTLKHRIAQMAVMSLDVQTGAIRVLIGGRNFNESRFNRATQGRRQAGSAFKPYVYAAAMENGFNPTTIVIDQPITLPTGDGGLWQPENYDRTFQGPLSIRDALARSNNLVAIQVFNRVGGQKVVEYTRNMGVRSPLHTGPSLAIGAVEVVPIEMTSTYGVFANNGVLVEPYFVQRILDKNGRVLEEANVQGRTVMTPQTAFLMNSMLSSVVCCGTGASIPQRGFRRPAAGKTGTTNDYSDAWFVGYTPQIVTGVWAGIDERLPLGHGVTGSTASIPVWVDAMTALHRDLPVRHFTRPSGISSANVCTTTGTLANSACPRARVDFFPSNVTLEHCTTHGSGGARTMEDRLRETDQRHDAQDREQRKRSLMF